MGGLVARSACYYGQRANHKWFPALQKIVFLGTPHHGAPLEKGGNWIDNILEISPYSKPFVRLGKIRSAGITDLRYGNLREEDWKGHDRFEPLGDTRKPAPLPENILCYTVATTIPQEPNKLGDQIMGDGLVPLNSGLGKHKNIEMSLNFPEGHIMIARNLKHLDLLSHPDVYMQIKKWLDA